MEIIVKKAVVRQGMTKEAVEAGFWCVLSQGLEGASAASLSATKPRRSGQGGESEILDDDVRWEILAHLGLIPRPPKEKSGASNKKPGAPDEMSGSTNAKDAAPAGDQSDPKVSLKNTIRALSPVEQEKVRAVEALLATGQRLRFLTSGQAKTTQSMGRYEKIRRLLPDAVRSAGGPGQIAWPPGAQTVAARFGDGSWAKAMQNLGVSAAPGGKRRGVSTFSEQDFHRAISAFLKSCEEPSASASYEAYVKWAKTERSQGNSVPAAQTVRQHYRSWSAALAAVR